MGDAVMGSCIAEGDRLVVTRVDCEAWLFPVFGSAVPPPTAAVMVWVPAPLSWS
jgi:hypothetical protein